MIRQDTNSSCSRSFLRLYGEQATSQNTAHLSQPVPCNLQSSPADTFHLLWEIHCQYTLKTISQKPRNHRKWCKAVLGTEQKSTQTLFIAFGVKSCGVLNSLWTNSAQRQEEEDSADLKTRFNIWSTGYKTSPRWHETLWASCACRSKDKVKYTVSFDLQRGT